MLKIIETDFYCFESHEDIIRNYIVSYLIREKTHDIIIDESTYFTVHHNHVRVYDYEGDIFVPGLKQLTKCLSESAFDFASFSEEVFELKINRFLKGWWVYFISDVFENQLSFKPTPLKEYLGLFEIWFNRKGNVLVKTSPSGQKKYGTVCFSIDRNVFDLELSRYDLNNQEYFPDPENIESQKSHQSIKLISQNTFDLEDKNDYEFNSVKKFIFSKFD